ncbi:MAG: hypothetical protein GY860_05930 [Desulfobacteraceae bacterium]|nr:hypothetical protein [Desulfobacteraceae bacterium]
MNNNKKKEDRAAMEISYYCQNRQCQIIQKKSYVLKLKLDDVMDEKNIAQMYCPHCKTELKTEKS